MMEGSSSAGRGLLARILNCSITTLDFLSTAQEPPPLPCSRYRCTFLHPRTDISSLISP